MKPEPLRIFSFSKGLSIIELLVVMSILTILASIGVTTYSGVTSRQRVKTAKHLMASFRTALEMYKTHNGFYPYESGVLKYTDFYSALSPYLSGDYCKYFKLDSTECGIYSPTSTFNYDSSVIDSTNLNVPTRYTISVSANVSDPSYLTATHKALEATLNGEKIN